MATKRSNGEGTIRKIRRGKYEYWEARITIGTATGTTKQIQRSFTGKTQKEVREKMQAAANAINEGDYYEPSKMTVETWLDIWLKDYSADWKYATKEKYENVCRVHLKPGLGGVKLRDLKAPQIQHFYNGLTKTTRRKSKKTGEMETVKTEEPLSPKSVRLIHGVLSKALNTAVRVGYLKYNPAERCTIPKLQKKEICPLTDAQVKAFVSACEHEEYGPVYKLILFTGLREGEALGLCWDAVDFKKNELKISRQLQHQGDRDVLVPLKNSKPRYLAAPPYVMKLLKDAHTHQKEQRLKAGTLWQGWTDIQEMKTSPVFLRDDGRTISASALYQRYKQIVSSIGIPGSRVHDLRHTFAVLSLQNGDSVKTVQDNLGHATAAFTLDVYGHTSERMKTDSAARMEEYIRKMA